MKADVPMSDGAQRFFLDVEKIRALVRDTPQLEAASIRQALADYDAYEAAGEAPLLWIERNQLVVGTLHARPREHGDEVVLTITIKTRIFHTAARDRMLDLMKAVSRIAEECEEFAALRVVGDVPSEGGS